MEALGGSFHSVGYTPIQQNVAADEAENTARALEALTIDDSASNSVQHGLLAVSATDQKIVEFCHDLSIRRKRKKDETNARFMDEAHVLSICGEANAKNTTFVQEIVQNVHFLGNVHPKEVAFILERQKPLAGILYIEEEWVPENLHDSCSPKILIAELKFSFNNSLGNIEHYTLKPDKSVAHILQENGARFLEVDPSIYYNMFFRGFGSCNLLRMQAATVSPPILSANAQAIGHIAKSITEACYSITREELDPVLAGEMRPYMPTDRYTNIFPYKRNCVSTKAGLDINGSYVRSGMRLFIACQGPNEATIDAFWQTVMCHRSQTVIALGPSTERQAEKFNEKYFTFDQPLQLSGGMIVEKIGIDTAIDWEFSIKKANDSIKIIKHCLITRTFELTCPTMGTCIVRHHHCPTWQDNRGGDPRILSELIKCIENTASPDAPIVVHCSAGIGRTGTLLAGFDIYHKLKAYPEKPITLLATIMEHRHQRYGSVQTKEQIEMLLKYLAQVHQNAPY